jgi:membrane-bound lytic murein transglycosylase D
MDADGVLQWLGKMVRMRWSTGAGRWVGMVACLPLLLLMGCPQSQTGAAGKTSPQVTAPAVGVGPEGVGGRTIAAAPAQRSAAAAQVDGAKARKVQDLINQAERAYASGVSNYRAGHLDAARVDFDSAVDLMLTSGMDLKTDPQMADEFDHLLNAVNSLEMAALKQGNGFSAPLEAAPLDAADEVTFPPNAELTKKVQAELQTTQSDFPLVVNDYVAGFISYFTNSPAGHAHLLRSLERAGKYKDMIQQNLRDAGLPQDLIYMGVAESGFQPQALNAKSGAAGMWQFMAFQGAYGLTRNGWYDERFDPDKSSKAYARYMKTLYAQFGDWYLAMAAYNWGPGYVQRAVMRTGYADFWELYRRNALPTETKNYVPGIIAAIIMAKNPQQYGLDKMVPMPPVVTDTVTTDYAIDLRLVADLTNVSVGEVVALNPSLLRTSTPSDLPFDLHVPLGTKDVYATRVKTIPEDRRSIWRFHVVRTGESLEQIATTMHARATDIAETNGIAAGESVDEGDELVIPVTVAANVAHPQRYTIRRGDTLVTVADRFNVSVDELRRWNHLSSLSSRAVVPGRSLSVVEPLRAGPMARVRGKGLHGRGIVYARTVRRAGVRSGGETRVVARASRSVGVQTAKTRATRAPSGSSARQTHRSYR